MTPRVYAVDAADDQPSLMLSADEAHHVERVLRLGAGDVVNVFDGAGREWTARIASTGRTGVRVDLKSRIEPVSEPAVHVVLGIGLLKGDQMDAVVRDATMLGVAAVAPLITAHVAVAGKSRDSEKAVARWHRVAVASAKQCGRAVVPRIHPPAPLATVLRETRFDDVFIALEPRARQTGVDPPEGSSRRSRPEKALVLVGPEGGWSDEEIALARSAGAHTKQLGARTLRAEAAPIVLLSALWTEWGWP